MIYSLRVTDPVLSEFPFFFKSNVCEDYILAYDDNNPHNLHAHIYLNSKYKIDAVRKKMKEILTIRARTGYAIKQLDPERQEEFFRYVCKPVHWSHNNKPTSSFLTDAQIYQYSMDFKENKPKRAAPPKVGARVIDELYAYILKCITNQVVEKDELAAWPEKICRLILKWYTDMDKVFPSRFYMENLINTIRYRLIDKKKDPATRDIVNYYMYNYNRM